MNQETKAKNKYEAIESFYQEIESLKKRVAENKGYITDSSPTDVLNVWESSERLLLESYHKTITASGCFNQTYTYKALLNEMRGQLTLVQCNRNNLLSQPSEVTVNLWIQHLGLVLLNIPKMLRELKDLDDLKKGFKSTPRRNN